MTLIRLDPCANPSADISRKCLASDAQALLRGLPPRGPLMATRPHVGKPIF